VDAGGDVNAFSRGIVYLNDPYNWLRTDGIGILQLLREHLAISVAAVLLALVVALPVGALLGHRGRGSGFVVGLSNVSRAFPVLGLLTVFAVTPIGFGNRATTIALAIFAVPPILTNTFVGFDGVDRTVREAARAMGMSPGQVIRRAEFPLALPLVMTGIRTATVQVVATTGLAALVGGGGLGRLITLGFGQQDYGQVVAGAILVAALALVTELVLVAVSWAVTPGPRRLRLPLHRRPPVGAEPEPTAAGVPL
jgi:osmoprotectant transport system permease protein